MLRIRLTRAGARKRPNYRVVVTEVTAPRDGRSLDTIGFYDPLPNPSVVRLDTEKAKRWLERGAQPTERVAKLFAREGLIEPRPEWARPAAPAEEAPAAPPSGRRRGKAAATEAAPAVEATAGAEAPAEAEAEATPTAEAEPTAAAETDATAAAGAEPAGKAEAEETPA